MNRPFPMSVPMGAPMGAAMRGQNPLQFLQRLQQNPAQFLKELGLDIPANMQTPNEIIQHLMNSGQVSQQQYNAARQQVSAFQNRQKQR